MLKDGALNLNCSTLYTAGKQRCAQRLATYKELKAVNCTGFSKEMLNILSRMQWWQDWKQTEMILWRPQDKHQCLEEIKKITTDVRMSRITEFTEQYRKKCEERQVAVLWLKSMKILKYWYIILSDNPHPLLFREFHMTVGSPPFTAHLTCCNFGVHIF